MSSDNKLPKWAPTVPQEMIRRLYDNDAQGIYDEEFIDEVGYRLYSRCESFIAANRAVAGEVPCPQCGRIVPRAETLRCPCGWELRWSDYFKTIQHKQLSGAEPVLKLFREYMTAFPLAQTPQQKVFLIDRLIHGFHYNLTYYNLTYGPTRPVAVNLIAGRMNEVVTFLDSLSYSEKSTPGTRENLAEWNRNIEVHPDWFASRRRA